ncbi:uncharacterized protein LOC122278050 isoform X1 [Carya illinoinensis]|uniref:Excitatory amino acid transporter n=1 Tax=Carya illinoinensis TaxID=32201 RepID=A0A8T1P6H8_CARIL|nr:uncharacterized protein LOC122278050 isoform X1 [Carya illinoinensis]KAG6639539.1 hypothetical protein CIPAW_10G107900 [Carya illinoinensis]
MAWSATMIGALLGLGTQMYSNALRKLPYMRHPWEHVVGMGLGAVFVNQLVKWDAQLQEDLDKMLAKAKAANERRYFGYNSLVFKSSCFLCNSRISSLMKMTINLLFHGLWQLQTRHSCFQKMLSSS